MAPLLIDGRDLLKLGIVLMLTTILVFFAGYLTGHQRAETYLAGSETRSLPLPEPVVIVQASVDFQQPETIEAGEQIDVDQPEKSAEDKNVSELQEQTSSKTAEVSDLDQKTDSNEETVSLDNRATELQTVKPASEKNDSQPAAAKNMSPAEASIIKAFSQDELNKIKYSIQVGMYGRLVNAENMMKLLQAQRYDTYVTDYINKKNEVRYNVRFGYFADKKSALETLTEFKSSVKGDGYLVKFSADNIVKTADAADIKQLPDTSAHDEYKNEVSDPVTIPTDFQDNISRVDVLIDQLAVTN